MPQVPSDPQDNPDRIQQRPYSSDFARLPEEEVAAAGEPRTRFGVRMPAVLAALGLLVVASVFVTRHWLSLVLGGVLLAAAPLYARMVEPEPGSGGGTGTVEIDRGP